MLSAGQTSANEERREEKLGSWVRHVEYPLRNPQKCCYIKNPVKTAVFWRVQMSVDINIIREMLCYVHCTRETHLFPLRTDE